MMATAKNKLSTDFQSAINCVPERSLLGAFGKQHHDYDHDVFNSAGSTLATPHFGPENGVHLRSTQRRAYGYRDEEYLKLKIVAAFPSAITQKCSFQPTRIRVDPHLRRPTGARSL